MFNKISFDELVVLASKGNVEYQNELGYRYLIGQGIDKDYSKSFDLFYQSSLKNDSYAQYCCGMMLYHGKGVKKDEKLGLEYLNSAASQNETNSKLFLNKINKNNSNLNIINNNSPSNTPNNNNNSLPKNNSPSNTPNNNNSLPKNNSPSNTPNNNSLPKNNSNSQDNLLIKEIFISISNGDNNKVQNIINNNLHLINCTNDYNSTPLHMVCFYKNNILKEFLELKGANYNLKNLANLTPKDYLNPIKPKTIISDLFRSSLNNLENVIYSILTNPSKVNLKNNDDSSPLHIAANSGNFPICHFLLNHGANPNIQNKINRTPLHWASKNGSNNIIELLLKFSADINILDNISYSPLSFAVDSGFLSTCELLISNNANFKILNSKKKNLLHIAVEKNQINLIEYLLSLGININDEDLNKETPLFYSFKNKNF